MSAKARRQGGTIRIKKYGNRRLYDTQQSKYITLDDLSEIVRSGVTVEVVEASTERDLTRQVLTQVVLEQQDALDMVPVELLHALIRVQGTLDQAPFAAFLATMTKNFVQSGNLWQQQMSNFFGGFTPMAPSEPPDETPDEEEPGKEAEPDESAPPPEPSSVEEEPEASSAKTDLDDIRSRMDKLLGKLSK